MTRINCVPVTELTNKHLLAEYRELPRVFKLARVAPEAPAEYTLGKGHVLFFYDKLQWLLKRQVQIYTELLERGFSLNFNPDNLIHHHESRGGKAAASLWNDWTPTTEAMAINRARIAERLNK